MQPNENTKKRKKRLHSTTHNSTYPKVAVQWLNQALCIYQSFCLVDSELLRNRHLRVAAKRWEKVSDFFPTAGAFQRKKIFQTFSQLDLSASGNAFGKLRLLCVMLPKLYRIRYKYKKLNVRLINLINFIIFA
jgi:hypothetical protein